MTRVLRRQFPSCNPVVLVAVALAASLSACGTVRQVEQFKELSNQQRYAEVAAQEVQCQPTEDGCNQLHLIKGDACFRLAKGGVDPDARYLACAADELQAGIQATSDWPSEEAVIGKRAQYYENLCESLRLLQDNQSTTEAANTNVRLLSTAEDFLQAEPGHLAATYFINSARLAQFQLDPQKLQESNSACATLNELLVDLEVVQPRAASSPYEVNYKRLRLDITGLKRAVPGCK